MKKGLLWLMLGVAFLFPVRQYACTNYLITKGASVDGSVMISYAADSHVLYGELYHWAAAEYPEGTMMDVTEWDTGKYLGKIKQASRTYNVVGNMNEFQVAIGETTFTGREELADSTAIIDYGSLIYITLQRAKSAREAIKIMSDLVTEYGYYSTGESLSISDENEVWIMEIIGKGTNMVTDKKTKLSANANKGAVWVAMRVPDGYVCGHANQARITTFPKEVKKSSVSISSKSLDRIFDPAVEVVYAYDVVTFARSKGWFTGDEKNFSFSDTYAPVTFSAARFSEIRVWSMFNKVAPGMDKYWDYVKGNIKNDAQFADGTPNPDHYATNRMPLWVKPVKKVSVHDMMMFMRDHLENTELDMSKDFGAGPFNMPYRWRPLTWKVDGVTYVNERATATQQTGFSFVAQSRSWLPKEIGGIIWWGVDDASTTVYMPMYSSITKVPINFERGNGSMMEWSKTSGFWITNMISNLTYTRYSLIQPDVEKVRDGLEAGFISQISGVDADATKLYEMDKAKAIDYLTRFSTQAGAYTFNTYETTFQQLFMKYMDGNVKTKIEGQQNPKVVQPGYGEEYQRKIVEDTGDKLKFHGTDSH